MQKACAAVTTERKVQSRGLKQPTALPSESITMDAEGRRRAAIEPGSGGPGAAFGEGGGRGRGDANAGAGAATTPASSSESNVRSITLCARASGAGGGGRGGSAAKPVDAAGTVRGSGRGGATSAHTWAIAPRRGTQCAMVAIANARAGSCPAPDRNMGHYMPGASASCSKGAVSG